MPPDQEGKNPHPDPLPEGEGPSGTPLERQRATSNLDTDAAWAYHDGTKHSWASVRQNAHFLDFSNRPLSFKVYTNLQPLPLLRQLADSALPALSAISSPATPWEGRRVPDQQLLSRLLRYSAGITKKISHPGAGDHYFRAAACTGALYHIDLYLLCGDLPRLEAGLYHFGAHDAALRRLRSGDYRAALAEASGREPAVLHAPATIICTSTFWRNAWKYQARAYRHAYWDSGTLLANLLAAAAAWEMPAKVVLGFADGAVNELLGLDAAKEVTVALVPLGRGDPPSEPTPNIEPLHLETMPLSRREVDYPPIRAMHAASSLASGADAAAWRSTAAEPPAAPMPASAGRLFPLQPLAAQALPQEPIERVVARRGSTRRFSHDSLTFSQLSTALVSATRGVPADFLQPPAASLNDLYLIVNNVEGLPQGAYVYHRQREALELLMEGDFRSQAGYLGLEQELPADASVDIFFLASLDPALRRFGNRGYRAAQIEAAIMGGKLYLSAYAQGLGATGLTFYDDDVTDFFSPHAAGKSVMFLVALGHPARRGAAA